MPSARTRYWVLLVALLIVATLGIISVLYSPRPTVRHGIGSSSASVNDTLFPASGTKLPSIKGESAKAYGAADKTQDQKLVPDISSKPTSTAPAIDESVVGQQFTVSASVKEGCKRDTIGMVREPRDVVWAATMEEKIQAVVDSQGPGKYVVRNLECRTSTCILEVEVHVPGTFNGYDNSILSSLRPNAMTISMPEYESSGVRFSVELMDFARR